MRNGSISLIVLGLSLYHLFLWECFEEGIEETMGVVDAAERGEVVFFVRIILGILIILRGELEDVFLVVCEGVAVDMYNIFFEHDDVLLNPCIFVHSLGVDGRL